MNCREAQSELFVEREGALDDPRRVALEGHLARCSACQRVRDNLTAALATWRIEVSRVAVPNPEREWQAVRRRIRGGVEPGATRVMRSRRNLIPWIAVPLAGAAAVALGIFAMLPGSGPADGTVHVAHANSVEVAADNATTVVFVDDKSGWLFVMASDPNPRQG